MRIQRRRAWSNSINGINILMAKNNITFYCAFARTPKAQKAMHQRYNGPDPQLAADIENALYNLARANSDIDPSVAHLGSHIQTHREIDANGVTTKVHILDFEEVYSFETHATTNEGLASPQYPWVIKVREERGVTPSKGLNRRKQKY